jgi:hypothetical protein
LLKRIANKDERICAWDVLKATAFLENSTANLYKAAARNF